MSRLDQIADLEKRFLLPTYNRYPVAFERGKGVFLFDFEGKKYLDFVAGWVLTRWAMLIRAS